MVIERVLPLEGIHNFRDCGGYPVSGAGRLRRGVLWRSGQHYGATDSDLEAVAGLGLVSVFDLRSTTERQSYPCRRPQDFEAEVFFSDDPASRQAPHVAAAQMTRGRTPDETRDRMIRTYGKICFRPELQMMMRRYFFRMAEGQGPSLINCMAGKDRTGIAVAMLLLAVGVHRDDVMEDYLLTNTAGDSEARIAAGAETVRLITGPMDDAAMRLLMGVEPDYLEAAYAAIEDRHGSIEAFWEEALGADANLREKMRVALVEG